MNPGQTCDLPLDFLLFDSDNSELRNVALQAYKRLTTDKRMNDVIQKFKRRGIGDRNIKWLLDTLPTIFGEWEAIKDESLKERRERHSKLAKKIQELAKELNRNEDTRYFNVCDARILRETYMSFPKTRDLIKRGLLIPDGIVLSHYLQDTLPLPPTVTISQYLSGFVKMLDEGDIIPEPDEWMYAGLPYKKNIQSYTIKRVSEMVSDVLTWSEIKVRQFPNKEVATIVNVLLNTDEPVTANDITQARIKVREHYLEREADRL